MKFKWTVRLTAIAAIGGIALAGCFGPGTYTTPGQIKAGLYHTAGNAPGSALCTWERDDRTGNPIGAGWGHSGPQYAQVEPSSAGDVAFKTAGCQNWVAAGGPYDKKFGQALTTDPAHPRSRVMASGVYRVGDEHPTLTGEMTWGVWNMDPSAPNCHWQRLRGFRGEAADILAEGGINGDGKMPQPNTVVVAATDVGFRTTDCGTLFWWGYPAAPIPVVGP